MSHYDHSHHSLPDGTLYLIEEIINGVMVTYAVLLDETSRHGDVLDGWAWDRHGQIMFNVMETT